MAMRAGVRIERSGVEKEGREIEKEGLGVAKNSWRFKRNGRGVGRKGFWGVEKKRFWGVGKKGLGGWKKVVGWEKKRLGGWKKGTPNGKTTKPWWISFTYSRLEHPFKMARIRGIGQLFNKAISCIQNWVRSWSQKTMGWITECTANKHYIAINQGFLGIACLCMYVCMYACMHACMHACMYVCMYVCPPCQSSSYVSGIVVKPRMWEIQYHTEFRISPLVCV